MDYTISLQQTKTHAHVLDTWFPISAKSSFPRVFYVQLIFSSSDLQGGRKEIEPNIRNPLPKFEYRVTQTFALIRFSAIPQPPRVLVGRHQGAQH